MNEHSDPNREYVTAELFCTKHTQTWCVKVRIDWPEEGSSWEFRGGWKSLPTAARELSWFLNDYGRMGLLGAMSKSRLNVCR